MQASNAAAHCSPCTLAAQVGPAGAAGFGAVATAGFGGSGVSAGDQVIVSPARRTSVSVRGRYPGTETDNACRPAGTARLWPTRIRLSTRTSALAGRPVIRTVASLGGGGATWRSGAATAAAGGGVTGFAGALATAVSTGTVAGGRTGTVSAGTGAAGAGADFGRPTMMSAVATMTPSTPPMRSFVRLLIPGVAGGSGGGAAG